MSMKSLLTEINFDLAGTRTEGGLFVNVDQFIAFLYKADERDLAEALERWKRDWEADWVEE